jgi:hypothetical protein
LGSWSSRCLVWPRLTLAKLCLVTGLVGLVGLAMLVVEVVGLLEVTPL